MNHIVIFKEYRNIMSDTILLHSGRVVDNPGDNLLAEFGSAVDAVEAAVQIQKKLKKENARFVEDRRLQFRIGINIGDIVQDADRIYGESVNVAARIESISDPSGICVSRNTYDHVKGKLELDFDYLGEYAVKNIQEPVRVYRVLLDIESHKTLVEEELPLPTEPSIAVLPFTNMSGDPSQDFFSDGLTEQVINGLCKVPHLFVIARNSSFAYKGRSVSIKQIAQELGVRYILEGSVQKADDRVRITAQLIDAATDYHMWSKNYDRDLGDIFSLQDEITIQLISEMEINLTAGEQARLWTTDKPSNIEAYDNHTRGNDCLFRYTEKYNKQAQLYYNEAIRLDNTWAWPRINLGYSHIIDFMFGWSDSPLESFEEAEKNAQKALSLNDSLDQVHSLMGTIYLLKRKYDKAIQKGELAIKLNPNGAMAHAQLGVMLYYTGKVKPAVALLERAFRLDPTPPLHYYVSLSLAYWLNKDYEKAINTSEKALKVKPDAHLPFIFLTMSYTALNLSKEAGKCTREILRINPNYSVSDSPWLLLFKHQETLDKITDILLKAGLPE